MNAKKFYATFVSLMLAIVMIMCTVVIVHAPPYPGVPLYPAHKDPDPAELMAVVGNSPGPGFHGGYHAMWDRIMPNLTSTIGFSSANPAGNYWPMASDWALHNIIWGPGWQYNTQNVGPGVLPPGGWDLTAFEWWTMPTGQLWNDGIILAQNVPPTGFNIFPYLNDAADQLYWGYQEASVAQDRKDWIDDWQKRLMTNPVMANVYFPTIWEAYGSYIKNFYGTVGWYDIDNLAINATKAVGPFIPIAESLRLLLGTLKYGVTEDWWNYNPAFIATRTEEIMANLITGTLYSLSLNPWPDQGTVPNPANYYSKPDLADGMPVMSPDGLTATIYLKDDVWWSDGEKFDSEDVKYTLDLNLVSAAKAVGRGDFAPIVSAVETWGPLAVNLTLVRPYNDLANILSNSRGLSILPEQYYGSIPVSALEGHASNTDATVHMGAPVLGPFQLAAATPQSLTYVKNPGWWGNSTAGYGYTIQETINTIILERVAAAGTRFSMLETHQLDFAEPPPVTQAAFQALLGRPDLTVFTRPYVASNGVWFNINNPYLSNRYVRLAICYSIPYGNITSTILPSWGVNGTVLGGNLVHPWQYCGGIQLFNTESNPLDPDYMPPYTYNPAWANAYLDMWKLSRIEHAPNATLGPVGDADFNGIVELDDLLLTYLNLGFTQAQMNAASLPGQDIDADFNNDNIVSDVDMTLWDIYAGYYYPAESKIKTYPY